MATFSCKSLPLFESISSKISVLLVNDHPVTATSNEKGNFQLEDELMTTFAIG